MSASRSPELHNALGVEAQDKPIGQKADAPWWGGVLRTAVTSLATMSAGPFISSAVASALGGFRPLQDAFGTELLSWWCDSKTFIAHLTCDDDVEGGQDHTPTEVELSSDELNAEAKRLLNSVGISASTSDYSWDQLIAAAKTMLTGVVLTTAPLMTGYAAPLSAAAAGALLAAKGRRQRNWRSDPFSALLTGYKDLGQSFGRGVADNYGAIGALVIEGLELYRALTGLGLL